jgi:CheY-like chemotaxis protein
MPDRQLASTAATATRSSRCLRLLTVGGRPIEARMIYHGDAFGPGRRSVYQSYRPCVEMTKVRSLPGSIYLNTFSADLLGALLAPYPTLPMTNDGAVRLPPEEVRRLVEWVDDPEGVRRSIPVPTLVAAGGGRGEAIAAELPAAKFDVVVALDGDEALRLAASHRPELVVAETQLSRIDGFQLARELRRNHALSRVVYLLVGASEDDEHGFTAGANACLPWPLEAADLRSTVGELLNLV